MYAYIHTYVYMYICVCIYYSIHAYTCTYIQISHELHGYTSVGTGVGVRDDDVAVFRDRLYIYTYMNSSRTPHIHICTWTSCRVCMYVCIYICMYIYHSIETPHSKRCPTAATSSSRTQTPVPTDVYSWSS